MSSDEKHFKKEKKKKEASSLQAQLELQWLAEKLEQERKRAKSRETKDESFQLQKVRVDVELERQQIQEEMRMAVLEKDLRQQMKIEQGREIMKNENLIRSRMKQQQIEQTLERRNRLLQKKQEELQAKIYLKDYNSILKSEKRRELLESRISRSRQNDVQRQLLVVQAQQSIFKDSAKAVKSRKPLKKKKQDEEESEENEEEESTTSSSVSTSPAASKTPSPSTLKNNKSNKGDAFKSPPSSNYIKSTEEYLDVMKYTSNTQELRRYANEVIVNFLKDEERAEQHRREFLAIITDNQERSKMEKAFEVERKKERSMLLQLNKDVNAKIQQMYFQMNQ